MTKHILKYPLQLTDLPQTFQMPEGAEIVACREQRDVPTFWVLADNEAKRIERRFIIKGTGDIIPEPFKYVGTVQQGGGALIWHVFEI